MSNAEPFNVCADGTCRTIKAQYWKNSIANFTRGGGTERQRSSSMPKITTVLQVWRSRQNGMVYDPNGISPCLSVGDHSGCEPKIIEYE